MIRNGRPEVQVFEDHEWLYFRWFSDWCGSEHQNPARISQNHIPIPDQSVNRSGLDGRGWFVLMCEPNEEKQRANRKLCQGILAFKYANLPSPLTFQQSEYTFKCEHDPLEHNYQHCEIRVYRDGARLTGSDWKAVERKLKVVKKYYRQIMADVVERALEAEVGTQSSQIQ